MKNFLHIQPIKTFAQRFLCVKKLNHRHNYKSRVFLGKCLSVYHERSSDCFTRSPVAVFSYAHKFWVIHSRSDEGLKLPVA
jgi:hypothetical protein